MDIGRKPLFSVARLHESKNASDLLSASAAVVAFHKPRNDERETLWGFESGKHWTDEELALLGRKRKAPVVVNKLKPSERVHLGTLIRNQYDMTPAPREPGDQNLADILKARYQFHAYHAKIQFKDPAIYLGAWVAGDAYQESYMEVRPGKKPVLRVRNLNPFAVYRDPDSKDLIDDTDCKFYDMVPMLTVDQICELAPEKEPMIRRALDGGASGDGTDYSQQFTSRVHESGSKVNDLYPVVIRYYKVRKRMWYGYNQDADHRIDIGENAAWQERQKFQQSYPEHDVHYQDEELLYQAIACEAIGDEYLFNGPYHCQPRDPDGNILFPIVMLVYEEALGVPSGNVVHQMGLNRVINSMFTNKLHNAKNAVNTSKVGAGDAFDEEERNHLEESHADGDQIFWTRPGVSPAGALQPITHNVNDPHTDEAMNIANEFQNEISSTPPAQRGVSEASGTPAALNEQRIAQAEIMQIPSVINIKNFLRRRAELWAAYDRIYFTDEETFRVIEKKDPKDPDFVTMNKTEWDAYGNATKTNDITAAKYDIVFEESYYSPTNRDKLAKQIQAFSQTVGAQQDPSVQAILAKWFFKVSDAPAELKQEINETSAMLQQIAKQKQAMEQQQGALEAQGQMQDLAQREAEQTAMPPGSEMIPMPERQMPAGQPNAPIFTNA